MKNFKEITGDLTAMRGGVICHQCNCTSNTWSGLAAAIFNLWPETNTYKITSELEPTRTTGEIHFFEPIKGTKVANIYSQFHRGKASLPNDSKEWRIEWFQNALDILENCGETNFFFPRFYGSGLAGGDWSVYRKMIQDFAAKNPNFTVTIVGLPK